MFEKLGKKIYDTVLRCGSTLKSKPRSRFRVATSLCPRTILVQFTVCGIGIAQGAPISKQLWPIFDKNLAFIFFGKFSCVQLNLCQKLLFFHQLTQCNANLEKRLRQLKRNCNLIEAFDFPKFCRFYIHHCLLNSFVMNY